MAWFGDSISSLSNLKGQITNFTKGYLSEDSIVEETDERSKALNEANERCNKLQDLLSTKDAEISQLRRQNCELQKTVSEINTKTKESDTNQNDETETTVWDPSYGYNRNAKNQRQLQEQFAQATVRIRELECELKRMQKINNTALKDDVPDAHQKARVTRAKQDMMNRIIQMEEKTREAERNTRRIQSDESALVNDFRSVISKLDSQEKFELLSEALRALQIESGACEKNKIHEKSDSDEKHEKIDNLDSLVSKYYIDEDSERRKTVDKIDETLTNKEEILHKRIGILQNENKDLLDAMEKLDEEYTQSIEKLLSLREEADKKHQCLQNAYEQLSTDYNETQKRIIILQNNDIHSEFDKDISRERDNQHVQLDHISNLEKHTQTTFSSLGINAISETNILDDMIQKVQKILKNYNINSNESEKSIFEMVAEQYVDTRWKLDLLEKKITELTRYLKEIEEMKDSLQIDCEEMQSHIDSLLLENQALKSNLPSIPEVSEERVAGLETDIEYLHEEIKRLLTENETIRETNAALMLTIQNKEASLRRLSDHDVDVEIKRITHQHNTLTSDNNDSKGNVNHEIDSSLEENKDSQKKSIDKEKQIKEEYQISLEKSKNLNEDIILIEQLKFDHENTTEEWKFSNLANNTDKSVQENIDMLGEKGKELPMELLDSQESDLKNEKNYLSYLQKKLDEANNENIDLRNDLLYKEEKLDTIQAEIDMKQSQITRLSQDNDRLIKENVSLSEQLTATHDESLDKIELLNTEMTLLQQEHEDLKQEMSIYKEELTYTKKKLNEAQEHYTRIENECDVLKMQGAQLEAEKEKYQGEITEKAIRIDELETELTLKESIIEKLNLVQDRCKLLEQEIEVFRIKELKLLELERNTTGISSPKLDKINKTIEQNFEVNENSPDRIEEIIKYMKMIKQNLLTEDIDLLSNNEGQPFDITKIHNERLINQVIVLRTNLLTIIENSDELAEIIKQTNENLSDIVRKKNNEIGDLQIEIANIKSIIDQTSNEFLTIKNQKDELQRLTTVKSRENLQYQDEIQKLIQHVNEQETRIQTLINEQTTHVSTLEDKSTKNLNKVNIEEQLLSSVIENSIQKKTTTLLNEKCDSLEAALLQERSNNRVLQNQLIESRNKGTSAARELERLRTHLVEIESSYTEEAIIAENSRQELETRLLQIEEKMKNSSTAYTSANIRANQQVETLQQQIALIIQQRDHIQSKLSNAEDNILSQTASLTNLQIVLEQFQQDKENDIISATEKIRSQLNNSYKKQEESLHEISILNQQLSEAKECLQAASRLSEQLEKKDTQIERLNEEVAQLMSLKDTADQKVKETMEGDEEKVDKNLIKNLLLGYLSSTTSDKSSILKVFATVLDFTDLEKDKAGLNNNFLRAVNNASLLKDQEASLSAAFVRFLESESKPKPQLPALPIMNSASAGLSSKQQSPSSTQSTLLLSNVSLPTFPDFIPARNTGSILKEVLKDS